MLADSLITNKRFAQELVKPLRAKGTHKQPRRQKDACKAVAEDLHHEEGACQTDDVILSLRGMWESIYAYLCAKEVFLNTSSSYDPHSNLS